MAQARCFVLSILAVVFIPMVSVFAADSAQIELVKQKVGTGKLSPQDISVLGDFIGNSIQEMFVQPDISQISVIRTQMVAQKGTSPSQYAMQYAMAAKKGISNAYSQLSSQPDGLRKDHIELNLLIFAAEVQSLQMADFGFSKLDDGNAAVQYWAIKTIASPQIASQLTSRGTSDPELQKKIVSALEKSVNKGLYPASLGVVVEFANALKDKSAEDLLVQIAEKRMSQYESWKVKYELLEADLLKALAKKALTTNTISQRALCAKTYSQLFSYVMQRYFLGQDVLSDVSKLQLTSVMVDVEQSTIGPGRFLDIAQKSIKMTLAQKNLIDLQKEHDKLLGSSKQTGRLGSKLKYDYGKDSRDNPITAPKTLKAPKSID